ncbi:hypothetical protein NBRC116589_20430 [Ruegeria sp. HU-ET01832]
MAQMLRIKFEPGMCEPLPMLAGQFGICQAMATIKSNDIFKYNQAYVMPWRHGRDKGPETKDPTCFAFFTF